MAHGLGIERIQLYLKFDQPLSETEMAPLRELVRRRAQGEPVAYILGHRDFFRHSFKVNSHTLIPRPETEHIVEEVLDWTKGYHEQAGGNFPTSLAIVDLGTGTGCLGLSLLAEIPEAKLISVDVSAEALKVAQENAQTLGVAERVLFLNTSGDNASEILKAVSEFCGKDKIDVLVSNPPYIEPGDQGVETMVHKYEPHLALYAEEKGLQFLKSWSKIYAPHLAAKALMLMEMGHTQGAEMREFYQSLNVFDSVKIVKDLSGLDRVVRGEKNG